MPILSMSLCNCFSLGQRTRKPQSTEPPDDELKRAVLERLEASRKRLQGRLRHRRKGCVAAEGET